FDEYAGAKEMVSFERYCLARMKGELVNAPAVIGTFRLNEDDYMLVREFIEGKTLSDVPLDDKMLDQILGDVRLMHEHGFVHGDIKLDNFLVSEGTVYIVDCLKVGYTGFHEAKSFDLICTICAMCQKAPVSRVLEHAREYFSETELHQAGKLLDIAVSKVDIELSDEQVRELRRALSNPILDIS
ncbi:MAG TPA: lipopolysaccharide core heptose(II) kinase RfaY, partial [Methanocella sp.]|nr:lipopolysaccharide core heptose(II) kinase RfaY [Methanocella sp.]